MASTPPDALLAAAAEGFATLAVPQAARDAALRNLQQWMTEPPFRAYQHQIHALIEARRWDRLLDAFYQVLPFGTGGRRGPVGVGPNRFNPWTLGASVQGHAAWLRKVRGEGPLKVVLACDVRCFEDLRGELVEGVPDPVRGTTSRDFARIAAEVYAAAGISVVLPPKGGVLSTPELSFAIRHLGADAGLNISASHNHPDDNGGKFYDHMGGQAVPPRDEEMADEVAAVTWVDRMSLDRARAAGLVETLPESLDEAYLQAVGAAIGASRAPEGLRIVFTGLHGTGTRTVYPALRRAGFHVDLEPTQAPHDGAFPSVPFRAPNPEVPRSMDAAVAHAAQVDADIVMACDPDADRLGLMIRKQNPDPMATDPVRWVFASGNDIAALVTHAVLSRRASTAQPLVFKTEVTSSFVSRVAEARGARVVGHLLVGFKYIGAALAELEERGRTHGIPAALAQFAVGVEESHGILVTTAVRDKDAAGGALVLADLAAREKARGRTLCDVLDDLRAEVGPVGNELMSTVMRGAVGRVRIQALQASLRSAPPTHVGERAVLAMYDRQDEDGIFGPIQSQTDRASRDVLVFALEGDARVVLRPSGTEPKNKVYVEVCGRPGDSAREVQRAARRLGEDFVLEMLTRAEIELPRWALSITDLVSVEHKLDFALRVVPELAARLDDATADDLPAIAAWLDTRISAYGADARALVADGARAWLHAERPPCAELVRRLFRRGVTP
jgi:phosphoglucomutase